MQHVLTMRTDSSYDDAYKQIIRANKWNCSFCRSPCVFPNAPAINGTTMVSVDQLTGYESISLMCCSMSSSVQWIGLVCSIGLFGSCNVT